MSNEREKFEEWVVTQSELLYGEQPPERTARGYCYGPTHIAWLGWQASRVAALEDTIKGPLADLAFALLDEFGDDYKKRIAPKFAKCAAAIRSLAEAPTKEK